MNIVPIKPKNQIGETEYRKLKERLSYSNLKLYAQNRNKFYKEVILGEVREEEMSHSKLIGNMVHCILADNGMYESTYILSSVTPPVGQMLQLVDEMYSIAKRTMKEDEGQWVQQREFSDIFDEAVQNVKYSYTGEEIAFKGKDKAKILEMFTKTGEGYYGELLKNTGKIVVSQVDMQKAETIVEKLKTHPYTAHIINQKTEGDIEVFNELVILYEIDGIKYRSMLDKVIIDHENKIVTPWDYKCTYDVENGWDYNYLKNGYYLQAALYDEAVEKWMIEHDLGEYELGDIHYIAVDTTGQNSPVIYPINGKDRQQGWYGFSVRGKRYLGVKEIHNAILWHLETGNWQTTETIHKNNGIGIMDIQYDKYSIG